VAQLQQIHLPPIPGPRRKIKTKKYRSGLALVLQSMDWAYPDVAWGAAWATSWYSPPGFQSQQQRGPTPPFQHGPPPPQQAFLGRPVGPAFASPGGMLSGLLPTPAGAPFGLGAPLPGMPTSPLWMPPQAAPPPGLLQASPGVAWNPNDLAHNFNTMTLTPPSNTEWYMDSGASSHMASNSGILSHVFSPSYSTPTSIVVVNGSLLPVTSTGHTCFPSTSHPLYLHDVLISHDIIKNLISVRRFTTDNLVSVEFDPFGLSVKDLQTRNVIIRCNSSGQLYPLFPSTNTSTPKAFLVEAQSSTIWHRRLGHLSDEAFSTLARTSVISCNKFDHSSLCHACQLGRHTRLPFSTSSSRAHQNFDLIHCDLWTSPVSSTSDYKYYLVILDDCSHFVWAFPLKFKSDTFSTLANFFSFVSTQFSRTIKSVQCDNGREFDNSIACAFFLTHGVTLRMSCPYTSQQNGKAEHILRTLNNITRSLLFQASLPPSYWVEALHTATYLLNRRPSKTLAHQTPYAALHDSPPSYTHLCVFGCKCYPNMSATAAHKLAPRSSLCVSPRLLRKSQRISLLRPCLQPSHYFPSCHI
jgi:hypothetical protein